MAPLTEEAVLTNFLIYPSSLPTIISLEKFRALFPKRYQAHPQVRALYRELQYIRLNQLNSVREEIEAECKDGVQLLQEVKREHAASLTSSGDGHTGADGGVTTLGPGGRIEASLDRHLFEGGQQAEATGGSEELHDRASLMADMERACAALQDEAQYLETTNARSVERIASLVAELSDLRYGKLPRTSAAGAQAGDAGDGSGLVADTIDGLRQLESLVRASRNGSSSGNTHDDAHD
ncbi:hypothetical protein KEM52_004910 [Ascosphaera acerosa]|nr:hypothetical protein KEM52_004910 [Ascosphaera acerosa]